MQVRRQTSPQANHMHKQTQTQTKTRQERGSCLCTQSMNTPPAPRRAPTHRTPCTGSKDWERGACTHALDQPVGALVCQVLGLAVPLHDGAAAERALELALGALALLVVQQLLRDDVGHAAAKGAGDDAFGAPRGLVGPDDRGRQEGAATPPARAMHEGGVEGCVCVCGGGGPWWRITN
jgi:hypothetical protein